MVISTVNQVVYNGDGITTAWPYTFRIIDATDIKLTIIDADGTETDVTADYFVDTVNNTVYYPGYAPGAEPPQEDQPPKLQEGQRLVVYRELPITQEKDLGDKWPFYVIELALDKLTMILQQVYDWWGRTLKVSQGATVDGFDTNVYPEAGKVITVNSDADGFECREALMEVSGEWDGEGRKIASIGEPSALQDAATKNYVDTLVATVVAEGGNITILNNVAALRAADIAPGITAGTKGYYSVNDGGAAIYTIRAKDVSDVDDDGSIIFLDNGNVAELITDGTVNVKQFGAKGDGVTDDTVAIQNACAVAKKVFFPHGTYKITDYIPVYANVLEGDDATILVSYSAWKQSVFRFYSDNYVEVKGFTFPINNLAASAIEINHNHNVNILDHILIENCNISNVDNSNSALNSCGIFIYRKHHNCVIRNNTVNGVYRHSSNPAIIHSCGINAAGIDGICEITNNIVDTVLMNAGDDGDADGIAVYPLATLTDKDNSSVIIQNNNISNCQGRWIKCQSAILTVANNVCKNDNLSLITNFTGIDLQTGVGNITNNNMFLFGSTGNPSGGKFIGLNASHSVSDNPYCFINGNKMYSENQFACGIGAILNHDKKTVNTITDNEFYNTYRTILIDSTGTANNNAYVVVGGNVVQGTVYLFIAYQNSALTNYIQLLDNGNVGTPAKGFGNFYYASALGSGMKEYLTNLFLSENKVGTFVGVAGITGSGEFPVVVMRRANGAGYAILHNGQHIYALNYVSSSSNYLYTYDPAGSE